MKSHVCKKGKSNPWWHLKQRSRKLKLYLEGFIPAEKILTSANDMMMRHHGYAGLARWEEPATDALLEKAAFEDGHKEAYGALAASVSPQRLRQLLAPYYDGNANKSEAVVEGILQLRTNKKLSDEDRAREGLPIIEHAVTVLSEN